MGIVCYEEGRRPIPISMDMVEPKGRRKVEADWSIALGREPGTVRKGGNLGKEFYSPLTGFSLHFGAKGEVTFSGMTSDERNKTDLVLDPFMHGNVLCPRSNMQTRLATGVIDKNVEEATVMVSSPTATGGFDLIPLATGLCS